MTLAASWLDSHRAATVILLVHGVVFWSVSGLGSPWATMSLECAPGAISELLLGTGPWPLWDSYDGATGGYLLMGLLATPLFALLGPSGWVPQLLAYVLAAGLVVLVYRMFDRWVGRTSALLGAAGLAFAPPVLFRASLTFGDWHWTQMLFDYGLALWVLAVASQPVPETRAPLGYRLALFRSPGCWLVLGLGSGLAITNSMGSIPFVGVTWALALLLVPGFRAPRSVLTAMSSAAVGASPFLYKLLLHRPFGLDVDAGEKTVGRLKQLAPDPAKLWDLLFGHLPGALHIEAALPTVPAGLAGLGASLWVVVVWAGLGLAVHAVTRSDRDSRAMAARVLPVLFVVVFVLAYVVLDIRLQSLFPEFSNPREAADRMLPPLLVGLLCSSAVGWGVLVDRLRAEDSRFLARIAVGLALVPVVVGGLSQLGLVTSATSSGASPSVYRASCFEPLGFFASRPYHGDSVALQRRCSELNDPAAARGCRVGAAWGQGFYSAGLQFRPSEGTTGHGVVALTEEALLACGDLSAGQRQACLLGLGWYVGTTNWGRSQWPLSVCEGLADVRDRAACWRGVGFPLGDHLHAMPDRLGAALGRVPESHRYDVVRGAGYSVGRTYASVEHGLTLCSRLGSSLSAGCEAGVLEALAER